jgi:hypothetical protein
LAGTDFYVLAGRGLFAVPVKFSFKGVIIGLARLKHRAYE